MCNCLRDNHVQNYWAQTKQMTWYGTTQALPCTFRRELSRNNGGHNMKQESTSCGLTQYHSLNYIYIHLCVLHTRLGDWYIVLILFISSFTYSFHLSYCRLCSNPFTWHWSCVHQPILFIPLWPGDAEEECRRWFGRVWWPRCWCKKKEKAD